MTARSRRVVIPSLANEPASLAELPTATRSSCAWPTVRVSVVQQGRVFAFTYAMTFGWDDGGETKRAHLQHHVLPPLYRRPDEAAMKHWRATRC